MTALKRFRQFGPADGGHTLVTQSVFASFLPVAVSGVIVVVLSAVFLLNQRNASYDEARMRAESIANMVAQQADLAALTQNAAELEQIARRTLEIQDVVSVVITSPSGDPLLSLTHPKGESRSSGQLIEATAQIRSASETPVFEWESVNAASVSSGGVRVGLSTRRQQESFLKSLLVGVFMSLLALVAIFRVQKRQTGKVLAPLKSVIEFTKDVAGGDLSRRAVVLRDDEIGQLANACNHMVCELEKSQTSLLQAVDRAQEASRLKSEFLANMSHEIRTPLNGVQGMIDVALQGELDSEQREALFTAVSSAHSLATILNDILDFSKIEAGRVELDCAPFHLRPLMEEVAKIHAVAAEHKKVQLCRSVANSVPEWVFGDSGRLRQILNNLLSNAVKFTAQGSISLKVTLDAETDTDLVLKFRVADTGVGIPKDKQHYVFHAFRQADGSATRNYGGTGLGLSICERLVGIMGGAISVDSEPGKGSTFTFTARFGRATAPAQDVPAPKLSVSGETRPLSVLLVEDNPINQRVALRLIQREGHTVHVASDGIEALDILEREKFDLVFMDIQMPRMDGLSATQVIRQREAVGGGHLPVVALTAHALAGDRARCLEAGMDGYLTKPVSAKAMQIVLEAIQTEALLPAAS